MPSFTTYSNFATLIVYKVVYTVHSLQRDLQIVILNSKGIQTIHHEYN